MGTGQQQQLGEGAAGVLDLDFASLLMHWQRRGQPEGQQQQQARTGAVAGAPPQAAASAGAAASVSAAATTSDEKDGLQQHLSPSPVRSDRRPRPRPLQPR